MREILVMKSAYVRPRAKTVGVVLGSRTASGDKMVLAIFLDVMRLSSLKFIKFRRLFSRALFSL